MPRINLNTAELEALWTDKHARRARVLQKAADKRSRVQDRLKQLQQYESLTRILHELSVKDLNNNRRSP